MITEDATIASLKIEVDSTQLDDVINKLDYIVSQIKKIDKSIHELSADGMPESRHSHSQSQN